MIAALKTAIIKTIVNELAERTAYYVRPNLNAHDIYWRAEQTATLRRLAAERIKAVKAAKNAAELVAVLTDTEEEDYGSTYETVHPWRLEEVFAALLGEK
jgi:uncharacterized protein YlxP (DUF503 family)